MSLVLIFRASNGDWCPVNLSWQVPAPAIDCDNETGCAFVPVDFVPADSPRALIPTKTVTFQGTRLSPRQRMLMEQRQKMRGAFLAGPLAQQVEASLKAADELRKSGAVIENPDKCTLIEKSRGTPSVAEWMGY